MCLFLCFIRLIEFITLRIDHAAQNWLRKRKATDHHIGSNASSSTRPRLNWWHRCVLRLLFLNHYMTSISLLLFLSFSFCLSIINNNAYFCCNCISVSHQSIKHPLLTQSLDQWLSRMIILFDSPYKIFSSWYLMLLISIEMIYVFTASAALSASSYHHRFKSSSHHKPKQTLTPNVGANRRTFFFWFFTDTCPHFHFISFTFNWLNEWSCDEWFTIMDKCECKSCDFSLRR